MKNHREPEDSLQSQGGKARAAKLSQEERSEAAAKAAAARWGKDLPQVTHEGTLDFGGVSLKCAILEREGQEPLRLISQGEFMRAMGMYYSGYIAKQRREKNTEGGTAVPPMILAQTALQPFILKDSELLQFSAVEYKSASGTASKGIPAKFISKICKVWLEADRAGALEGNTRQKQIADKAFIIQSGLSEVGLVALVDEATGYQSSRARGALQAILDAFLRKEFAAWAKKFPDEFYEQIYRLRGWKWPGMQKNRIQYVGKLTKDVIYKRLAPGVLEDLEKKNPKKADGERGQRHHQWLTEDIGHPALAQHMHAIIGLMRASKTWDQFHVMLDMAFPVKGSTIQLELAGYDGLL